MYELNIYKQITYPIYLAMIVIILIVPMAYYVGYIIYVCIFSSYTYTVMNVCTFRY